jgi:hypothetical protein
MRAGRGIRAAAVLTVGLVGLAVIAPGIASAETTTPSPPTCESGQVLDTAGTSCVPAAGTTPDVSTPGSTTTGSASDGSTTQTSTTGSTAQESTTSTTSEQTRPGAATGSSDAGGSPDAPESAPATAGGSTSEAATGAANRTAPAAAAPAAVVADTPASVSKAASALTGTKAAGATLGDVLGSLPTGNLDLGTIPSLPASGEFENARDACLYLASKVNAPAGSEGALSEQFAGFCDGLPTISASSLTDLITALTNLLSGLKATPTPSTSTHTTPIHTAWGDLPGSFHDLDCAQLTYDDAQAVLADDHSDPNHLDGDHDGVACERNPRDYRTVCDDYVGYPVGAVATGDSAPVVDPRVAAALGGLALAAVAGASVTRREEPADAPDDVADPADDLLTAEEH